MNLLPAFSPGVGDDAKAPLGVRTGPLLQGQAGGQQQNSPQKGFVLGLHMRHGQDVGLGNDQKMHRRPRVDVVEGKNLFVFIDFFARYLAGNDFAKDAVGVGVHGGWVWSGSLRSFAPRDDGLKG